MCTYLHGPRGAVYYFRRAIPKPLQPYLASGTAWMFSLHTKDRTEAKDLVALHTVRTNALIKEARARFKSGGTPPTPVTKKRLALSSSEADRLEWEMFEYSLESDAFFQKLDREEEAEREANPDAFMVPDAIAAAKLRWEAQRLEEGREIAREKSRSLVSIKALFEGYAKIPGLRAATIRQFGAIVDHLRAFLGHDDAARVTPADIVKWRNALLEEPLKSGRPRTAKTINSSYLAAASLTFGWGVDNLLIPSNPVSQVSKVRADKVVQLREKDFTIGERQTILAATMQPIPERLAPKHALARRWVPWLCAYTGARVNEITQLRAEDVKQIDGVWSVRITPEAGNVKTNKARTVPLHDHLIEQGFLAAIGSQGAGPLFYRPSLGRDGLPREQHKRLGMRLAAWVRELGITDPAIKPNHAWRHTFKTICMEAGIDERAADYIQGHASKGIGRSYGSNTLPALVRQLALFPRFAIDAPAAHGAGE